MSPIMFTIIGETDDQSVTIYTTDGRAEVASSDHPNFQTILQACLASLGGDETIDVDEVAGLFDIAKTVEDKFARLSERVTVKAGKIYLDGDEVESAVTTQILRFLDEGADVDPLVNFMEHIEANPNEHSRQQAFDWLNNHDFTVTSEGFVVGYKGVESDGNGGFRSTSSGQAWVNDVEHNGKIPNAVGDIVTMPRSEVNHDPSASCHAGLHVGTFNYAERYASRGVMLEVHVNPRDIVSVPTDAGGQKIRVCRYKVVGIIEEEISTAFKSTVEDDEDGMTWEIGDEDEIREIEDEIEDLEELIADLEFSVAVQRDLKGRWTAGRPSERDPKTGRFVG